VWLAAQTTIPDTSASLVLLPAERACIPRALSSIYANTCCNTMLHNETKIAVCNGKIQALLAGFCRYLLQMKDLWISAASGTILDNKGKR